MKEEADLEKKPTPTLADAEAVVRETFGSSQCLMQDCFLTGSVAFGEANEESDIDIAFSIMSRGAAEELFLSKSVVCHPSEYNSGTHADVIIGEAMFRVNFLFLHPLDYVVWRRAGAIYKTLPRQGTRAARHALFQSTVALVKTAFALSGIEVHKGNYLAFANDQPPVIAPPIVKVSEEEVPF